MIPTAAAQNAAAAVRVPRCTIRRRISMPLLSAFITDCAGHQLTRDEWLFMQDARPAGMILFQRNCASPDQVAALIASFRDAVGRDDLLVLIDQEGGRVQRLKPPHWRALPPAAAFGALYRQDPERATRAAMAASRLVASELSGLGINMNCAPVLDVPAPGAHNVIGDRAFGKDVDTIATLGRAVAEGLMQGGVLPVIKHIPGHGRATRDTHEALPVVDASLDELDGSDFETFRRLNDMPAAMTAHIVFSAVDPMRPVSTSPQAIEIIIRRAIGFDGLLMCDDIGMRALEGSLAARAEAVIDAGCDLVLHCNGSLAERIEVADATPLLEGDAERRYEALFERTRGMKAFDANEAVAALEEALAQRV
jgi:beta-N-acetylhexosaminidase